MNISDKTVKILTKTMGALALSAVSIDSCRMGQIKARASIKDGEASDALRNYIGSSKMDSYSPMYSKIKEKTALMYPHRFMNALHGIKGFAIGLQDGVINHSAIIGSAIFTLCSKKRVTQLASAIFLGAVCAYNLIKNGTGLMEKRNDFDEM